MRVGRRSLADQPSVYLTSMFGWIAATGRRIRVSNYKRRRTTGKRLVLCGKKYFKNHGYSHSNIVNGIRLHLVLYISALRSGPVHDGRERHPLDGVYVWVQFGKEYVEGFQYDRFLTILQTKKKKRITHIVSMFSFHIR